MLTMKKKLIAGMNVVAIRQPRQMSPNTAEERITVIPMVRRVIREIRRLPATKSKLPKATAATKTTYANKWHNR